ncbi:MFS transporter [uncultured Amnibacterium sp.]|uniref:MFS transporter n=1 Tax=uncultured Amnibacterium sp. TaxID=1631851 RepID=UPI0035CA262E
MGIGRTRTAVALGGLTLATFTFITAETLPIGLLPLIARGLDVPVAAVGLLVGGYALVVVLATIPLTRLVQRVPRRLLMGIVLAVLVLGTAMSALASGYGLLLAARVLTALAHSVFWAIVVPIAAVLVDPAVRGRAVSTVYAGGSVATVLGVPFATWLGQAVDWRAAFAGTSALGAVALALVTIALPSSRGARTEPVGGSAPDRRRYLLLVAVTALTSTGALAAFTYISPFLTDVSGVPEVAVGGVLLARGLAGLVAVLAAGRMVDRFPRAVLPAALGMHLAGLLLQAAGGAVPAVSIVGSVLTGAGFAAFSAAVGAQVLAVAPGSVDVATAGTSTAFNVGISSGAVVGGAALPLVGLAGVPAVALAFAAAGFALALGEQRVARIRR